MKLLLTNDDGVDAAGLLALKQAVCNLGDPIIIAPSEHRSGCSHQVTMNGSFAVHTRNTDCYAVDGTPADCVRIGLYKLATKPDWIFSGVNQGGNLGIDAFHSGTIAAVREGAFHGIPGIAVSQYRKQATAIDWQRVEKWTLPVIESLIARPHQPGTFWNVNLPHLDHDAPDPVITFCPLDPSPLPLHFDINDQEYSYSGNYHQRSRQEGCDIRTCFDGHISVTQLSVLS
ncbi:MAG: 5'/3'-nucleotidase SurE [Planctomycetes bacterium]|nr:5'/3'-nucleotidase SurE [Planctomycetota bacterium]